MSPAPGVGRVADTLLERRARIALWVVLGASWVVAVVCMWEAVVTISSAELGEESGLVGIPTHRTFVTAAIFSGMELGLVLTALWPWRPAFYAFRTSLTAMGLVTWFIMTTPTDTGRLDWVHRRWLAFLALAVTAGLLTLLAYRLWRRRIERRRLLAS